MNLIYWLVRSSKLDVVTDIDDAQASVTLAARPVAVVTLRV